VKDAQERTVGDARGCHMRQASHTEFDDCVDAHGYAWGCAALLREMHRACSGTPTSVEDSAGACITRIAHGEVRASSRDTMKSDEEERSSTILERKTVELCGALDRKGQCVLPLDHAGDHACLVAGGVVRVPRRSFRREGD
jgi:hypothetical protein